MFDAFLLSRYYSRSIRVSLYTCSAAEMSSDRQQPIKQANAADIIKLCQLGDITMCDVC